MKNVTEILSKQRGEPMSTFKVLQITDCHLGSECNSLLLGLDTDQSLYDVLQLAQADEAPDLILVTGDISGDAGLASYSRFLAIMDQYFPTTPLAWLPGNHDDPENMIAVGKHPIEKSYVAGGWNMVLLDSRIPGEVGGRLGDRELQRLKSELEAHPDLPAAVFLHHQPVPVGSAWVDDYVLEDAEAFLAIIDQFPQIKMVSWGHVHQEFYLDRKGVDFMATPSTCIQFAPNCDEFKLDETHPAYRYYTLSPNGEYDTRIERAVHREYEVDMTATGY